MWGLELLICLLLPPAITMLLQNATNCGYRCQSGDCISLDHLCDGKAHCLDASDETAAKCSELWCPGYSFRCNYGACIAGSALCDGTLDCADGSDEQRWLCKAQMLQGNCDKWELSCMSGQCVSYTKLCDGQYDCLDGDDEGLNLCDGIITSTSISTSLEALQEEPVTPLTLAMRKLIGCELPQLDKVIMKSDQDAVLQAGNSVRNGTSIYYACPAEHSLRGLEMNLCQVPSWLHEFPYCSAPTPLTVHLVIAIFSILMLLMLFVIFRLRKTAAPVRDDRIWLVETGKPRSKSPEQ